jgi:hypothetical protein
MIRKPNALQPPPDREHLRWLLQRFEEYRTMYDKPYAPGTREYRVRLLCWLNNYKHWCGRLQKKYGIEATHTRGNWLGTRCADYTTEETMKNQFYLGDGQVYDVLGD